MPKVQINIKVDADVLKRLRARAKAEKTTLTNLLLRHAERQPTPFNPAPQGLPADLLDHPPAPTERLAQIAKAPRHIIKREPLGMPRRIEPMEPRTGVTTCQSCGHAKTAHGQRGCYGICTCNLRRFK